LEATLETIAKITNSITDNAAAAAAPLQVALPLPKPLVPATHCPDVPVPLEKAVAQALSEKVWIVTLLPEHVTFADCSPVTPLRVKHVPLVVDDPPEFQI